MFIVKENNEFTSREHTFFFFFEFPKKIKLTVLVSCVNRPIGLEFLINRLLIKKKTMCGTIIKTMKSSAMKSNDIKY